MKELFEKINVLQLATILFLGTCLIVAVLKGNTEIAMSVGSGMVGYLGGVTTTNKE